MRQIREVSRDAIIAEARSWIGTPFHHMARVRGAGVDCAQLLVAVYVAVGLTVVPTIDYYSPEWFLHEASDRFVRIVESCGFTPVALEHGARPHAGDIALFRFGRSIAHGGVIVDWPEHATGMRIVHAYRERNSVVEDDIPFDSALGIRFAGVWTSRTLTNTGRR